MFVFNVPVSHDQYSSIAGRRGFKIGRLKARYGVQIHIVDNVSSIHPLPYFIIMGDETQVNRCVIEIQRQIIISITNNTHSWGME